MKGFNHPIFNLLCCLVAGIVLQKWLTFSVPKTALFTLILAIFALIFHLLFRKRKNFWLSLPLYACFVSIGILTTIVNDPLQEETHFRNHVHERGLISLSIQEVLKPTNYARRYVAGVNQINAQNTTGKVLLTIARDSTTELQRHSKRFEVDNVLALQSTIKTIPKPRNPYQFDYAGYMSNLGIHGQIYTHNKEIFILSQNISSAYGFAARLRNFLQQRLIKYDFAPREWGVINALLLGQRQQLSPETRQNYIDAGVIHILAISGLHVGIILFLLRFIFKPLGNKRTMRRLRSILVILGVWIFAFIAGLSPSVLRAATMFTFLQIGLASNRKNGGMNGLIASGFFLLLIDSSLLFQVGFQLSYAAVFFILWLQPSIYALWKPKNRILSYFWGVFSVTFTAQLGVLPLSLFYFHQFSSLFFISNILVIPFLGIVLGVGIFNLILAAFGVLPAIFAEAYEHLVRVLNDFIFLMAGFDTWIYKHIYFSTGLLVLTYLVIVSSGRFIRNLKYNTLIFMLVSFLILISYTIFEKINKKKGHITVLHQYKESTLIEEHSGTLRLFSDSESDAKIIGLYQENTRVEQIQKKNIGNYYIHNNKEVLIIDSLGIYAIEGAKPDYILLRQSPKINLNRLLKKYPDVELIADGSNYKSYIERWETTCAKEKIPFHSTYEKGAFIVK
ncbi:ComEC/Rec2 family competence protein [Flavimarina sp. Hel_I_48]|uniref:ComEC/Rec2 family competence protein n=1 Tax=Flavimarina sp. Hel_I_48 TaxID=1392488 RepID=UPI00068A4B7D|nr:ComEC/Rec2 family competence protein [Flavimarina sp. Hel_I_48]